MLVRGREENPFNIKKAIPGIMEHNCIKKMDWRQQCLRLSRKPVESKIFQKKIFLLI